MTKLLTKSMKNDEFDEMIEKNKKKKNGFS